VAVAARQHQANGKIKYKSSHCEATWFMLQAIGCPLIISWSIHLILNKIKQISQTLNKYNHFSYSTSKH
jgi:hypothetical protein